MTRDYAKKRPPAKARKRKSGPHLLLWLFTLVLFAAFTAGLVYLGKFQHQARLHHAQKIAAKHVAPKLAPTKPTPQIKSAIPAQFDFYTILPQKKANNVIPEYEIEIAIAKDFATADRLKAELLLLGFEVTAVPVKVAGKLNYRVTVGPYDTKEGAKADQVRLQQNKYHTTLKKIK